MSWSLREILALGILSPRGDGLSKRESRKIILPNGDEWHSLGTGFSAKILYRRQGELHEFRRSPRAGGLPFVRYRES